MLRLSSEDVLAHSLTVLKTFKDASSKISAVPALPAVVGALIEVVEIVETIRQNRKLCLGLKKHVIELGIELKERFDEYCDVVDPRLDAQLTQMISSLDVLKGELETHSRKGRLFHLAHYGSIKESMKGYGDMVDGIKQKFVRTMLTTLLTTAIQQASFTKDGLFFFREVQLERLYKRDLGPQGDIYSEQWIAEYGNRMVAVRYLRPGQKIEDILRRTLRIDPPCGKNHIAQYLGHSHPAEKKIFVVLETGSVNFYDYFRSPGKIIEKLRSYLQMLIDWEGLYQYMNTEGLLVVNIQQVHYHSAACLTSLSVGKHGTFVVEAEDLRKTSVWCLDYHFRIAYNQVRGVAYDRAYYRANYQQASSKWSDFTHRPIGFDTGSRSMMRILDCGTRTIASDPDIGDLYKVRLPQIWSDRWEEQGLHAEMGDYGYEDRQRGHFVRLGNVFDIAGSERFVRWQDATHVDGTVQTVENCDFSAEQAWRLVPEPGKRIARGLEGRIRAAHLEWFWWFYACAVAERHTISLEDLVVVRGLRYSARMDLNIHSQQQCTLPDAIFFHRLPAMASGEMPSQVGYWSFEAEPSPGPWPRISIPGLTLRHRKLVQYTYLSALQAQLVRCFYNCLGEMCPLLPSSKSRVIECGTSLETSKSDEVHQVGAD